MLKCLIKELQSLAISLDFVSRKDVKSIIDLLNERVQDKTNSFIIDLLVKKQSQAGVILEPIVSTNYKSRRGSVNGKELNDNSTGVWAWAYNNLAPLWLDNLIALDKERDTVNKYGGELVNSQYLEFYMESDGILVVPLIFKDSFMGIYSVEFPEYVSVKKELVDELIDLSRYISVLLWKADVLDQINEDADNAINHFRNAVYQEKVEKTLDEYRSGFFARPFSPLYSPTEEHIRKYFSKNHILLKSYLHKPGSDIVVDDIRDQIESSHFGIIDISECNPNVMLEFGMIKALDRKVLLIQRKDDPTDIPFDIKPYHVYKYDVIQDEFRVLDPATSQMRNFEEYLSLFVKELMASQAFQHAKPYR